MVRTLQPRYAMRDAVAGLALTVILMLAVAVAGSRLLMGDPRLVTLLGYLAVWLPLAAVVVVACKVHGSGSFSRDVGLRVHPIDLLWGLSVGLLARVVATLIEIIVYGSPVAPPPRFVSDIDLWWVFSMVLAPVLIGPFIEEVFFRGLLLRAVLARFSSPVLAVVVSGAVFAAVHLVQPASGAGLLVLGSSTLVFGLAAATLAVLTGRAGGAIVAHITFNGLAVVPGLL